MSRNGQAGFSLVEMLVVLAIVGVMAGATILSLGAASRDAQPETEARLLATRLSLASDEALVTGDEMSLRLAEAGYSVDVWSPSKEEWAPHPNRLFGVGHAVPRGVRMTVEGAAKRVAIRPDGAGAPVWVEFAKADAGVADKGWRVLHDGFSAYARPVDR